MVRPSQPRPLFLRAVRPGLMETARGTKVLTTAMAPVRRSGMVYNSSGARKAREVCWAPLSQTLYAPVTLSLENSAFTDDKQIVVLMSTSFVPTFLHVLVSLNRGHYFSA
jgi:hypothetical protein